MKLMYWFIAACLFALSGCATVVNGRTEPLGLSSNPSGAEVTVDNGFMKVVTPTAVELKRDEDHTFVFHKDGYQDASATVTSGTSGWVWGNLLAGGIVGGVVDFATGAAYKFSNDNLSVNLVPVAETDTAPQTGAAHPPTAPAAPAVAQAAPQPAMNAAPQTAAKEPAPNVQQPKEQTDQGQWEKQ